MRKIILYLHMSVDNVVSDPEKWMLMDDDVLRSAIEHYEQIDTVIVGSHTYPHLADYWPNAEKNSASEAEREFARRINRVKKIVLSRSSVDLTWNNSELLKFTDVQSLSGSIQQLKEREGKNISVESGLGTWKMFLENSLFDELFISIHPVIVGQGDRVFADVGNTFDLFLRKCKTFKNGVIELSYSRGKIDESHTRAPQLLT